MAAASRVATNGAPRASLVGCVLTAVIGLLVLAGCASQRPPSEAPPSYPGFDLWRYPGDDAMQTWREASPYEWVGVYLPAPCHRDSSWVGTREALERMGWGTAVLYVGQQVFEDHPESEPGDGPIICSRTLLSAEQGRADARDAIAKAAAEGYSVGTILFLDVEKTNTVPAALLTYVRSWMGAVFAEGPYVPGLYVHRQNAATLFQQARAAYRAAGRGGRPPMWIAGGDDFALDRSPGAVGLPFASIWQGVLDAERTWGGVTLSVDENVADRPSPSAPRRGS
jgi:hypothetical protein